MCLHSMLHRGAEWESLSALELNQTTVVHQTLGEGWGMVVGDKLQATQPFFFFFFKRYDRNFPKSEMIIFVSSANQCVSGVSWLQSPGTSKQFWSYCSETIRLIPSQFNILTLVVRKVDCAPRNISRCFRKCPPKTHRTCHKAQPYWLWWEQRS